MSYYLLFVTCEPDLVVCPVVGSGHLGTGHLAGAGAGEPTQLRTFGDGPGPGEDQYDEDSDE